MRTLFKYMLATVALFPLIGCGSTQSKVNDSDSTLVEVESVMDKPGVDLGLSVNWAECNVGADSPDGVGFRIPLGNTKGTMRYKDVGSNVSGTEHDIAVVKLGDGWRMPTGDEFRELRDKCSWTSEIIKGRNGYRVTGPNGNSIFLPCTGSNYQPESMTNLDIVDRGGTDDQREGNYWFGSPTDFNVVGSGLNQLYFDVSTGEHQFYYCQPYSLNAVRPVHD